MYTVSVPIILKKAEKYGYEKYLEKLNEIGASRVMLALDTYVLDKEKADKVFESLSDAAAFFKSNGFEVGAWIWTFMLNAENNYMKIQSPTGGVCENEVCPTDKDFIAFASEYIKNIARCGVDLLLFDDDFRFGFLTNVKMGCTCPNHINMISEILGENITREDIKDYLISGGKNKYRSAFLKANKISLINFSKEMRRAVDSVNESIRFGVCACLTTWDFDGADSIEVARALAGNTKPLIRLIGAPYWAPDRSWGNRLSDVIELERLERSWCPDDIEIISEGDTYPRPAYATPVSYLEGFDTALRADGSMSGILKYMIDYVSSPDYELKYIESHIENKALYEDIHRLFSNKKCVGLSVYEAKSKYEEMDIPTPLSHDCDVVDTFFPITTRAVASSGIPTKYGVTDTGIVFGDNAKFLNDEQISKGLILDIRAAEILQQKGIDVGLKDVGIVIQPTEQTFNDTHQSVRITSPYARRIQVSPSSIIASIYEDFDTVASYLYENSDGARFYVMNYEAHCAEEYTYRNYEHQRYITVAYEWISGRKLPAFCKGYPDIYILAKESDNGKALAVGVWNFSADKIKNLKIELGCEYRESEFINCNGNLDNATVTLDILHAFEYAFFEVKI